MLKTMLRIPEDITYKLGYIYDASNSDNPTSSGSDTVYPNATGSRTLKT